MFWGYPLPPHDYSYHQVILDPKSKEDKVKVTNLKNLPKFQIFAFWNKHYTWHTFWSCLIRCANMKRIRWVLLKKQSRHDSVHRRTDGQGETSIPSFQLRWSRGYNNSMHIWFLPPTFQCCEEYPWIQARMPSEMYGKTSSPSRVSRYNARKMFIECTFGKNIQIREVLSLRQW